MSLSDYLYVPFYRTSQTQVIAEFPEVFRPVSEE